MMEVKWTKIQDGLPIPVNVWNIIPCWVTIKNENFTYTEYAVRYAMYDVHYKYFYLENDYGYEKFDNVIAWAPFEFPKPYKED